MSESRQDAAKQSTKRPAAKKAKKHEKQLDQLTEQVEQLTQDLQRERADFANYRRRNETEKQEAKYYAKSEVVTELLPLLDDLERALAHAPENLKDDPWAAGVSKVYEQFQRTLNDLGVFRIDALDCPFDPEFHEAVGYDGSDTGASEVITEELRAGYQLEDTVLRPSLVRVGAAPPEQNQAGKENE